MPETFKRLEQRLQKALDQKNYHEMQSDMLSETLKKLEAENAALKAKIADYESGWRSCMDDNAEEQHCTCVPALKIRVQKLTAMLKRLEWHHESEMGAKFCFECSGMWPEHAPNCALAALLKGADDANPAEITPCPPTPPPPRMSPPPIVIEGNMRIKIERIGQ